MLSGLARKQQALEFRMIEKLFIVVAVLVLVWFLAPLSTIALNQEGLTLATSYKPWVRYPSTKVLVPVIAANTAKDKAALRLKKISVFYHDRLLAKTSIDEALSSISKKGVTAKEFSQMLKFEKASKKQKEHLLAEAKKIKQDIEVIPITVDLQKVDLSLNVGREIDLTVEASYVKEGIAQTTEIQTQASVAASLPAMDGWRPGDAHLHSNYSDDNQNEKYTVDYIAKLGKERGLKWLLINQAMDLG